MQNGPDYLAKLRDRAKQSRVYRKHQLDGLEIAKILGDETHKTLYMKLAKERDAATLRELAASIASRKNVKNPGALFMYLLKKQSMTESGKKRVAAQPRTKKRLRRTAAPPPVHA